MKNNIAIILFLFLGLISCKNDSSKENPINDSKKTVEDKSVVTFTDAQIKATDLQLGNFENKNLTTTLKINGKLSLPPQYQAQVSILAGGVVKNILVQEGEFVTAEETLATIVNTEVIQLQQDYLENNANLNYLEQEYQRQKELREDNINAGKTYQQAQKELQIAQAKKVTLGSKLAQLGINAGKLTSKNITSSIAISAPISGYIQHINLSMGKYADANAVLFEIIDNRFLHLDLKVFEKDIHKIKIGQSITFSDANDVSHTHPAKIYAINKAFEPNEQAVLVHAKINETTETLLPGMYVEARVKIDNNNTTALPTEAIVSNGNDHFIFVATGKNTFQQIKVTIGTSDLGFTEVKVIDLVPENTKVVIKGAYYLLSELTKGSGEE
ncbi:efflux RND transporter periplasmic adaptor subunit [Flavobacterium aquariorum]|uniref:Efflux RND transporter periplasmic adaptor subunit n=1 Tax=Flavobacterium aquariorum TaxID=2217670 RepID=A0A2W7UIH0_9FLAO|nr:efflux RND transporter periplasmic adaptor subunit [Flavobacterium aquariorum]PZX93175.1 efflux RND transporter periplasmic adaptor subunit [Flavobacterium aquariorum]